MKTGDGSTDAKRRAGESAADLVADGDVVGLGTGTTAAHAIRALGAADRSLTGVPTSFQARDLAREVGLPLAALDEVDGVDVAIDGADQVSDAGALLKGGGAAHAREKVVAAAAERVVVVVDPSKETETLDRPVPVSVSPDARRPVAEAVEAVGGEPTLRRAEHKDGPVVTDDGALVLDCDFGVIDDPESLSRTLSTTPGVVEHGLFVGLADEIHVGTASGVRVR